MKSPKAHDFPELQRVFTGYLHEDFLEAYGTPAEALRVFQEDAGDAERERFRHDARRFLDRIAPLDFKDVRALVARLGCRWMPPSRQALVALLVDVTNPPPAREGL